MAKKQPKVVSDDSSATAQPAQTESSDAAYLAKSQEN